MDGMTVLWIVIALAALVILVALIAGATRKASQRRAERDRQEAYEQQQQARASEVRAEDLHPDETSHAATWGQDRDGPDRDRSSERDWGRDGQPMAGATDEQPAGEHWADGQHPDDPRRQPRPDAHQSDQRREREEPPGPKHSRH